MLDQKPVLKIALAAGVITAMVCLTIAISSYLSSTRPVYVQYNTGADGKPVNNIAVSAVGKVTVSPDIVTFNVGYETKKADIASVQKDLSDRSNQITKALTDAGILAKDIQTTSFDIYPSYRYEWTTGKRIDEGHQGNLTMSVKVRDISKAGEIIDKAVAAGANTVSSITFTIDDLEKVRSEARKLAASTARTKASELASASGVEIGSLISINETSYDYQPMYYNSVKEYATASDGAGSSATSVSGGSLDITITVSATYGIK